MGKPPEFTFCLCVRLCFLAGGGKAVANQLEAI